MKAYCTYCSAQKDPSRKMLPAIKRYRSRRITSVYRESQELNLKFFILSGKFGLLHPSDEVPFYDHLLQHSEVDLHTKRVAGQIEEMGLNEIVFFVRSSLQDRNIVNYIKCMEGACQKAGARLSIQEYLGI